MQPKPAGHHILIKPKTLVETDASFAAASRIKGFIIAADTNRREAVAISVGQVIDMGPIAYKDTADGLPWCKIGDWVAYARHGGMYIQEPSEDGTNSGWLVLNDIDVVAIVDKETQSVR
jgi:co-chaperonin GroES (HSP10)